MWWNVHFSASVCKVQRVQKKVSDSLDLELQTVVGHSKLMLATEFMFLVTESSLQCPTFANMFLLCACVCFLIIHWLLAK